MSYIICQSCGAKVEMNHEKKFICPKCGKEVKPQTVGWGGK